MGILKFSGTILKNLFNKPVTKKYPIEEYSVYDVTRGKIEIDIEKCILCGICNKKCPTKAIEVDRKASFWSIDRLKCIQCSSCVENCPKKCLVMNGFYTKPTVDKIIDKYEK